MPISMGSRHLSSKKYQPQMTNHFEVQIEGLGEDFTLTVSTCNLPEVSNPAVEIPFGNSKVKVAGQAEYSGGDIEVTDTIGADTENIINSWRLEVYDPETDKMGWAEDYKREAVVTQYGPDGTSERVWKLEGVWPETVSYGSLDYSSSDAKKISMTLAYDRAYPVRS